MTWALDSDVLIYAATRGSALGAPVRRLVEDHPGELYGSQMLWPELLIKPVGAQAEAEVSALVGLLARVMLVDVDDSVAAAAVDLGASYGLRAPDAIHLASAVLVGARAFVTNNTTDFPPDRISEIEVLTPAML